MCFVNCEAWCWFINLTNQNHNQCCLGQKARTSLLNVSLTFSVHYLWSRDIHSWDKWLRLFINQIEDSWKWLSVYQCKQENLRAKTFNECLHLGIITSQCTWSLLITNCALSFSLTNKVWELKNILWKWRLVLVSQPYPQKKEWSLSSLY